MLFYSEDRTENEDWDKSLGILSSLVFMGIAVVDRKLGYGNDPEIILDVMSVINAFGIAVSVCGKVQLRVLGRYLYVDGDEKEKMFLFCESSSFVRNREDLVAVILRVLYSEGVKDGVV
jgi:hypothetical protein